MLLSDVLGYSRIGATMLGRRLFGIRKPLTAQVLVTKFCNMTCNMCFTYPIDSKEKFLNHKEPTLEELVDIIDQSCKLGAQVIVPFGGEPLIRKDIGQIIKAIKDRRRYCVLYTNGTYVPKRIDDIINVDQLVISIDGDEETHDSIRGKGSYKKAIYAVELALSRKFNLRLHTVLTKRTLHTLPHMVHLAKKYDVMLNYGYTDATALTLPIADTFVPTPAETIAFLKEYLAARESGVKISSPASVVRRMIKLMESWPIEGHTISKEENAKHPELHIPFCGLHFSNLYIDSDGSATPCLPLWGKPNAPNVYKVGVKGAWEHYDNLPCHQCRSVFTIEKGLFYTASLLHLLEYIEGFQFLKKKRKDARTSFGAGQPANS